MDKERQEAMEWLDRVMNSTPDRLWAYCIIRAAEIRGLAKPTGFMVFDVDPILNRIENIRIVMATAHSIYRTLAGVTKGMGDT